MKKANRFRSARNRGQVIPLTKEQMKLLFTNLTRACVLDRMMMRIIRAGKMVSFYHEGGIALAPGVAAASFLRRDDFLCPHYRAHGIAHLVAKGVDMKSFVAEHMGRATGCCAGRSGFHFCFPQNRVFGLSGNIGANFPVSIGYGYAAKLKRTDQVVVTCSGDGSYGEGRAHEAMLMSANWKLPVVFWCENNGIAQYSALSDIFPSEHCSNLAAGYGIPSVVVDGQDVFACGQAALEAIAYARAGKGPFFVECMTLRAQEHNVGGLNAEGAKQRDAKLMEEWRRTRDPLKIAAPVLIRDRVLTQRQITRIQTEADREAEAVEVFADQSPKATPPIEELLAAVYAD